MTSKENLGFGEFPRYIGELAAGDQADVE